MWSLGLSLFFTNYALATVLYESPFAKGLRPRTFYLSSNQEYDVISRVICQEMPCPEFTVIRDYPFFIQQRMYRSSSFLVTADPKLCDLNGTVQTGLVNMFKYFGGLNEREKKFQRTVPMLIEVNQYSFLGTNSLWCKMSYAVTSFIPHYWGSIPKSPELAMVIRSIPEGFQVYTHTFNGPVHSTLLQQIELFRRNLITQKLCFKTVRFYIAIYDIPHNPGNSRNELWFEKC